MSELVDKIISAVREISTVQASDAEILAANLIYDGILNSIDMIHFLILIEEKFQLGLLESQLTIEQIETVDKIEKLILSRSGK